MASWPASGERLVLVGLMGTGKSTVGRILAARAGCRFLDSDDEIAARTGKTVREIFEEDGEAAFRRYESQVLADALDEPGPLVVAAAGGVVLDPQNRERLASAGRVVWLRADPDLLADRAPSGGHRPLLADDPLGVLRRMDEERSPLYREVAADVIDITGLDPPSVADRVMELVG